jgi:hypothetical protein
MPEGTHSAMRVVLAVIGTLVTLGSLVSLGVIAVGLGSVRIVTETRALPTDMRLLAIDTGDVPAVVRLITDADAREPRVDLRMVTRGDTQLTVAEDAGDSRVTLNDSGSGFLWFNRTGEIRVILPPDVARELSVTVNQQARSLANTASLDQSSSPRPTAT